MTTRTELVKLEQLVELKYRQQQESFARLMTQENKLRLSLRQLDQHLVESRSSGDTPQKAIGADIVWQAWIGRKKRELNIQLAQVLAVKELHVAQVRKAYGKVLVTKDLCEAANKELTQKKAQSSLDRAITSMLL